MIHRSSYQQLETLLIDTELARCEIALFGGQVLSFVPRRDGRDLLWCSPARLKPGRAVRGGVPVCWPWFARQGVPDSAPQHGFVRTATWHADGFVEHHDGAVSVTLSIEPAWQGWPAACAPTVTVRVGSALSITLETRNDSARPVTLTQALHTYFRVGDVREAGLEGLLGLRYLDKIEGFAEFTQHGPWRFDTACDRIYLGSGPRHVVDDPVLERTIVVESEGSASTVVWNPGPAGIGALGDVPLTDWYQYLCVEAANCGPLDSVVLAPGASTRLTQRISAGPRP